MTKERNINLGISINTDALSAASERAAKAIEEFIQAVDDIKNAAAALSVDVVEIGKD